VCWEAQREVPLVLVAVNYRWWDYMLPLFKYPLTASPPQTNFHRSKLRCAHAVQLVR
jgi:hypothetical protein